jgi:hypothetical protein
MTETTTYVATIEVPTSEDPEELYYALEGTAKRWSAEIPEMEPQTVDSTQVEADALRVALAEAQKRVTDKTNEMVRYKSDVREVLIEAAEEHDIDSDDLNTMLDNLSLEPVKESRSVTITMSIVVEVSGTGIDWDNLDDPSASVDDVSFGDGIEIESMEDPNVEGWEVEDI